ncbi:Unknown protein [Striga hermonthica]|uniref:Uncharacterized protein n=1 Tax=Striga hermonthica TaxID=68872 RepID=A0A9N7RFW2_STRHE|nr:Unknown protein [Striga hermonthica]
MAVDHERQTQKPRRKQPSFSSSLLDAIYRSIDETGAQNDHRRDVKDIDLHKRNNGPQIEKEIESLRRAIMIEKWIESHGTTNNASSSSPTHMPSNSSGSSTESTQSSTFSPTDTESSSSASKKSSQNTKNTPPTTETQPKRDGKLTIAKIRARKIYGELKKAKEPISPGGRISNFLNSIFSPRASKNNPAREEEWGRKNSSVMKSRSVNDTRTSSTSFASRSCLSKSQFSSRGIISSSNINNNNNNIMISNKKSKSTRSVRFLVDENKGLYGEEYSTGPNGPVVGSRYIKKNIDSLRLHHDPKNAKKHEFRDNYYYHHHHHLHKEESEFDDMMSCASSDLFELENIGRAGPVGMGAYEEELPVYGTTSFKMNQISSVKFNGRLTGIGLRERFYARTETTPVESTGTNLVLARDGWSIVLTSQSPS